VGWASLRTLSRSLIGVVLALSPISSTAAAGPVSIRWTHDPSGRTTSVSVVGLSPAVLDPLRAMNPTPEAWAAILAVEVDFEGPRRAGLPAMLGTYRIEGDALQFTPRFPLDRGRTYRAIYRPGAGSGEIVWKHLDRKPARPATVVARVDPPGDRLPENLLKFYLHFSAPMGRGEAYDHLSLLGDDGKPVDRPFLEIGEELWDPSGTRLTLLFDPGRIKRGLRPREELGPILKAGRSYTLAVDPAWRDAEGDPLGSPFRKAFRAEPADEVQPDPKNWLVARPLAATCGPLALTFPEALDRALLESGLNLVDARDQPVLGRAEVDPDQRRWRLTPDRPWVAGEYQILIDADLEDLAGNSIRRPFEVDVQRDTPARPEPKTVRLRVAIGHGQIGD